MVVKTFMGQLLGMVVELGEILHEHQGVLTLIHDYPAHFFRVCGMIGQGNETAALQKSQVGMIDQGVELRSRVFLRIIHYRDDVMRSHVRDASRIYVGIGPARSYVYEIVQPRLPRVGTRRPSR